MFQTCDLFGDSRPPKLASERPAGCRDKSNAEKPAAACKFCWGLRWVVPNQPVYALVPYVFIPQTNLQVAASKYKVYLLLGSVGAMAAVETLGSIDINSLSCILNVQMSGAKMLSCTMNEPALFTEETSSGLVDLTPNQLASVACDGDKPLPATIRLASRLQSTRPLKYKAANGKWFTVQETMEVIGKYETATRGNTKWFGGVDTHHVFFEGFDTLGSSNGRYCIGWGS